VARRPRAFGRASEEPYRRRASDWVRLGLAALLLSVLAVRATYVSNTEGDIYDLVNSLPQGLDPIFRGLQGLGALWAVGLVAAAALVGKRWRLARDLLLSGLLAWAIARVLGSYVVGHIGLRASLRTLTHRGTTPPFPLVRLSLVYAIVAAAGPYVGRPVRRRISASASPKRSSAASSSGGAWRPRCICCSAHPAAGRLDGSWR
jgi:undecaprenyl-diphosphatase